MPIIYLGLGSNMGEREKNILTALDLLKKNHVKIIQISKLIETRPVGGVAQAKYLNGALKASTTQSPQSLLSLLKKIEAQMGRVKTITNGPRPIDLDILLYQDNKIKNKNLIIPHPGILKRSFVLKPLKEIYPEFSSQNL